MLTVKSPLPFPLGAANARPGQTAPGLSVGAGSQTPPGQSAMALQKLQDRVLETLANRIPGATPEGLKKLDANEFTPEKVADRIGKFVALGLENARAQGKSEEDLQRLHDSAMKGAERGFREAREILKGLDILNGNIAEQVDETERLTFDALAGLSPQRKQPAQELAGLTGVAVAERYQRADRFELNLKTREGDTVTIRFGQDIDARSGGAMARDGAGNEAQVFDLSRTERSGFAFSVQGDLSTEEIDAIQNLVRDVGQLANEFFNGDVTKAFEQAANLSFDKSQLGSLELNMSRSERYSATAVAAQRYQETQKLRDGAGVGGNQPGLRLGNLMREMRETFDRSVLDFLDRPRAAAGQIMQGLVEQDSRFKDAGAEQQERFRANLGQLLKAVQEAPPANAAAG